MFVPESGRNSKQGGRLLKLVSANAISPSWLTGNSKSLDGACNDGVVGDLDIIGDIHGCASQLEKLLDRLG